ncbi:MAG: hypothetical protein QOD75_874 [Blastocatellia bacterium]|jgi:FkbM family methyltransferase|nr:hypothetical protein [Blastocatellia bacterium]
MDFLDKQITTLLLGSRTAFRIGRALYQRARGDTPNHIMNNGESLVQKCVIDAWKENRLSGDPLVVFDVGANAGDWSDAFLSYLASADAAQPIALYLFEPAPATAELLKARFGTENPRLHYEQVALSSENGDGVIFVDEQSHGINSLHANPLRHGEEQVPIVKATVNDFCQAHGIQNIHLLKSDTEGHDMELIRGALPLLEKGSISILQFEYNHRWVFSRNFLRDAFSIIEKLPYKLVKLEPNELLILSEWHPELERFFEGNYALIHADAMKWFPTRVVTWDRYNTMAL